VHYLIPVFRIVRMLQQEGSTVDKEMNEKKLQVYVDWLNAHPKGTEGIDDESHDEISKYIQEGLNAASEKHLKGAIGNIRIWGNGLPNWPKLRKGTPEAVQTVMDENADKHSKAPISDEQLARMRHTTRKTDEKEGQTYRVNRKQAKQIIRKQRMAQLKKAYRENQWDGKKGSIKKQVDQFDPVFVGDIE